MDQPKATKVSCQSRAAVEGLHQLSLCDMGSSAAKRLERDILAFSNRMDQRLRGLFRPVIGRHPRLTEHRSEYDEMWNRIVNLDRERNTVLRAMYARMYEITQPEPLMIHNLIVTVGLSQLASWNANNFAVSTGVNYGAIGTGTNTPALTDTQLETEVQRQAPSSYSAASNVAYFSMYYPMGTLTSQTYYEYGWFINGTGTANSGTLFSHFLLGVGGIAVTSSLALVVESNFTYTG